MKKSIIIIASLILILSGIGLVARSQAIFSLGKNKQIQNIVIEKGESARAVGKQLSEKQIISHSVWWDGYVFARNLSGKILPGRYNISGQMTIPEIALILTTQPKNICQSNEAQSVLFKEGLNIKEMADILNNQGLNGNEFLSVAKKPNSEFISQFDFLSDKKSGESLEGYLFPDTYCFANNATGESMVRKMLENFQKKLDTNLRQSISAQNKTLPQILTMASIIEGEVQSDADRKVVSGLFWNRIKNGQALQSCATIAYVLGKKKNQYTFNDTRVPSPYNTYLNVGLPPAPINNPGISSIEAAIFPEDSPYNYFLSDPKTGKTVFSKTIEEHNANKLKYGL